MNEQATARPVPWLSMILPARNEANGLASVLEPLQSWRARGVELILVDGASTDATPAIARPRVDQLVVVDPGRARQMNAGAALARAPRLWFVHADTRVDDRHLARLARERAPWGHFRARLSGRRPLFRAIETLMNLRSRCSGISTGDQSLFVDAHAFNTVGGYPDQPLMEDIALSARLRARLGRPVQAGPAVTTSSRRWEQQGAMRTIVRMWWLRWRYWRGADPAVLYRLYEEDGP